MGTNSQNFGYLDNLPQIGYVVQPIFQGTFCRSLCAVNLPDPAKILPGPVRIGLSVPGKQVHHMFPLKCLPSAGVDKLLFCVHAYTVHSPRPFLNLKVRDDIEPEWLQCLQKMRVACLPPAASFLKIQAGKLQLCFHCKANRT